MVFMVPSHDECQHLLWGYGPLAMHNTTWWPLPDNCWLPHPCRQQNGLGSGQQKEQQKQWLKGQSREWLKGWQKVRQKGLANALCSGLERGLLPGRGSELLRGLLNGLASDLLNG
jgi:hypothetical protein